MDSMTVTDSGELVNEGQFFAPASSTVLDQMLGEYKAKRSEIEWLYGLFCERSLTGTLDYFCRRGGARTPTLHLDDAICALNAEYWSKALALTDVYNLMPQARRDAWNAQLSSWKNDKYKKGTKPELDLPDFTEDAVKESLLTLLSMRGQFFAERVDGIFRSLSREHVTNQPQGFSKRMILARVFNEWGSTE